MTDSVHARIHANEPALVESVVDPAVGDSSGYKLPSGDDAVLPSRYRGNNPG
jgi:hypothetical protein